MEDVSHMTGESNFKRSNRYSEVTFNGSKGEFYFRDKDAEKDEKGKYPKEALGESVSVVFMKLRRVLQAKYKPNTPSLRTSEHNVKGDTVVLFEGKEKVGTFFADSDLSKSRGLYTNQIVYCYFPLKKEVVRLILKGASLGSDKTAKGVMKFYDYMQSFKEDDHLHNFITNLIPVGEDGPQGTYYAIDFQRGEKLDDEKQTKVISLIKEVHGAITENDARLNAGTASTQPSYELPDIQADDMGDDEDDEGRKYPEEEPIRAEDIPF